MPRTADKESIFTAALALDGEARAAFLDAACGQDLELRAQVESLLKHDDQAGSFIERPAVAPPATLDQPPERPGAQIGPYKLLEQIGEGGFGVVYMAEQHEPVRRKVALKVLKPGMDSRQIVARFGAERQALALMDHPNIARVFDGGTTPSGRPYFVMELVKGVPITRYCDEQHLTLRERLKLFVHVCQAVQHAHQKGIIHRDLKPTNVLVAQYDDQAMPKVIDFGVAKATSDRLTQKTMFTQFGQLVGTLEYMSPEQARLNQLDVDTRSDIYSLGVLLYELLTGCTPFDGKRLRSAAFDEVLRIIREEEPPKPSTRLSSAEALPSIAASRNVEPSQLGRALRGELDWIAMKALDKDRNQRYETANGFAGDLVRYLNDEPVLACPPSAAYRFRKFAKRNKSAIAVSSLIVFFITLTGGGAGWAIRDRTAREAASELQRQTREAEVIRERNDREAQIERERATRRTLTKERVGLALDEAWNRHQEGRRPEALDAAKRGDAVAAAGETDRETLERLREVLGDMQLLTNLQDVRVRSTQNEAGYDLNEEDRGNAQAFRDYGIDVDALSRDEAAQRIRTRPIRRELAVLLDSWSHVRRRLEQRGMKPAGKDWKELLEIARAADPDPWRDEFRKIVLSGDRQALIEIAASAPIASLPAETVDRLGDALMGTRDYEEAVAFLTRGQQAHPQDYWINVNLGLCLRRLQPPQMDEAVRFFTAAVALRPESAESYTYLASALEARGDHTEATQCYRRAAEISPKYHFDLGLALERQQKPEEAIVVYREGLKHLPENLGLHEKLAAVLTKQRRLADAAATCRQLVHLKPQVPIYSYYLALLELQRGDQAAYREVCSRMLEQNSSNVAYFAACTCVLDPDAVADWTKPLELAKTAHAARSGTYETCTLLGTVLYRAGRFQEASQRLTEADAAYKPRASGAVAYNCLVQAMVNHQLGDTEAAARSLDKATQALDKPATDIWDRLLCNLLLRETQELLEEKNQ